MTVFSPPAAFSTGTGSNSGRTKLSDLGAESGFKRTNTRGFSGIARGKQSASIFEDQLGEDSVASCQPAQKKSKFFSTSINSTNSTDPATARPRALSDIPTQPTHVSFEDNRPISPTQLPRSTIVLPSSPESLEEEGETDRQPALAVKDDEHAMDLDLIDEPESLAPTSPYSAVTSPPSSFPTLASSTQPGPAKPTILVPASSLLSTCFSPCPSDARSNQGPAQPSVPLSHFSGITYDSRPCTPPPSAPNGRVKTKSQVLSTDDPQDDDDDDDGYVSSSPPRITGIKAGKLTVKVERREEYEGITCSDDLRDAALQPERGLDLGPLLDTSSKHGRTAASIDRSDGVISSSSHSYSGEEIIDDDDDDETGGNEEGFNVKMVLEDDEVVEKKRQASMSSIGASWREKFGFKQGTSPSVVRPIQSLFHRAYSHLTGLLHDSHRFKLTRTPTAKTTPLNTRQTKPLTSTTSIASRPTFGKSHSNSETPTNLRPPAFRSTSLSSSLVKAKNSDVTTSESNITPKIGRQNSLSSRRQIIFDTTTTPSHRTTSSKGFNLDPSFGSSTKSTSSRLVSRPSIDDEGSSVKSNEPIGIDQDDEDSIVEEEDDSDQAVALPVTSSARKKLQSFRFQPKF